MELKFAHIFFQTILGFSQHKNISTNGIYEGDETIRITTVDKIQLKCDFLIWILKKGNRQSVSFSSVLNVGPGQRILEWPKIRLFQKLMKL